MNNRINNEDFEPVCRFGPGGDFTFDVFSRDLLAAPKADNSLTRVLKTISQIMAATLSSEFNRASVKIEKYSTTQHLHTGGIPEYAHNSKSEEPTNPETVAATTGDLLFPNEPMLFADNCRNGIRTAHKQEHRVRAHRRTTKKRTAMRFAGQGSLFETNVKSVRTA